MNERRVSGVGCRGWLWTRPIASTLLLFTTLTATAAPDWPEHPGDVNRAAKQLEQALRANYPGDIFDAFGSAPVYYIRDQGKHQQARHAARRILALERMGRVSVHSMAVKRAFAYAFNTARVEPTRHHEMIELYERIAVPNSDDPYWRIVRARGARALDLPETVQLYEQVAEDMTGVPPDDQVRKLWEANRQEFDLPPYTKDQWRKQTTTFIYDATGLDVPGSPPIEGSPFPLIDLAGALGADAAEWNAALDASPNTHAQVLDGMMAAAVKIDGLPWRNTRGFLNAHRALSAHLRSQPAEDLAPLRELQEATFRKAVSKGTGQATGLDLFRRYPWSESAQQQLLESARKRLFAGEVQAAFRCFEDVLHHAEGALREEAQVGLWVSLAQFAEPDTIANAFDGIDANATWPWRGKREKVAAIRQQLAPKPAASAPPPLLASLTPKVVHLPPLPIGAEQSVFSVDMQRDGQQLLVSNPKMLAMYDAGNPAKPVWVQARRRSGQSAGGMYVLPRFVGKQLITSWGADRVGDYHMVAFDRHDKSVISANDPHDPYSRVLSRFVGSPAVADNKAFMVQITQSYALHNRMHQYTWWGGVGLSCFGIEGMKHLWTREYDAAQTTGLPRTEKMMGSLPIVDQGAVYFVSNAGHVIRADCRDGELEWMHFFRPVVGPDVLSQPSPWCLGGGPLMTDDTVICMPKFSGRLFALDRETGRRIWAVTFPRAYELLGVHGDLVVLTGVNKIYAIDVKSGKMRWGRQIAPEWCDGFQLPRAQLVGGSVYCGTKNNLYRFDARYGATLETRPWNMGNETPMSFYVSGKDLYVISDLPLRDAALERQLVEYNTVIAPAGLLLRHSVQPGKLPDGSQVIWRDGLLMRIKDKELVWGRFVTTATAYGGRMHADNSRISTSTPGISAGYDANTGQLQNMGSIKIGVK
jgi:hypothetical protein